MGEGQLWPALAVAALCGAAVGTERQWSGHAEGEHAHFGGLRTFTLLGLLGSVAGWLWGHGAPLPGALLLGAAAGLVVAAYAAASVRDIDGTTTEWPPTHSWPGAAIPAQPGWPPAR